MCIVDRNHFPEGKGLGISQVPISPNSPSLAPSSRRPPLTWVLLSPCAMELCWPWGGEAFFLLSFLFCIAG